MKRFIISIVIGSIAHGSPAAAEEPAIPDLYASSEYVFVGQVIAIHHKLRALQIQELTIVKAKETPENLTHHLKIPKEATSVGSLKVGDQIVVFLKDRYFADGLIWGTLTADGSYAVFPRHFTLPPEWILKKPNKSEQATPRKPSD